MKTKRTLIVATVLVALAVLFTLGILRGTRQVQAQAEQPPTVGERISFGMVGVTQGQTARLNVTNAETHGIVINFRLVDSNGDGLLLIDGQPVQRTVRLEPGQSASLQIRADNFLERNKTRLNFRAEVTATPASGEVGCPCELPVTLEVIDNTNGRTAFVMSKESVGDWTGPGDRGSAAPPVR